MQQGSKFSATHALPARRRWAGVFVVLIMALGAALGHFDDDRAHASAAGAVIASIDHHAETVPDPAVSGSGHCVSGASCGGAVIPAMQRLALPFARRANPYAAMRAMRASGEGATPSLPPPRQHHIV